jgi:hypothetical protein
LFLLPSQHDRGSREPVGCSGVCIRLGPDGVTLQFEFGLWGKVTARGMVLDLRNHVYFVMSSERQHGVALLFCIFNGVSHSRVAVLDGMSMTTKLVGEIAQHAYRVIGFCVRDPTDDGAFRAALRRTAKLTQGEMDAVVPARIAAAFAAPVMSTRSPSRIRLTRRESRTCQEEFLSRHAYAEQRESLEAVRALFAAVSGDPGHA